MENHGSPTEWDRDDPASIIHQLTAQRLIDALSNPETCTPGWIQAACRFLKDNQVEGLPTPGSDLETLYKALPFK